MVHQLLEDKHRAWRFSFTTLKYLILKGVFQFVLCTTEIIFKLLTQEICVFLLFQRIKLNLFKFIESNCGYIHLEGKIIFQMLQFFQLVCCRSYNFQFIDLASCFKVLDLEMWPCLALGMFLGGCDEASGP